MTTRENRGGPRVPDGVQRAPSLPGAGSSRTDLNELPGTPGTPLPPNPNEPQLQHGQVGQFRRALSQIPLQRFNPQPGNTLTSPTGAPQEPITAGLPMGAGPGPDALVPSPNELNTRLTAAELKYAYPLIMKLASLPNATTETKILAQRLRANLPVQPEQMPVPGLPDGIR